MRSNAGGRPVAGLEREGSRVAHPAGQGWDALGMVALRREQEGRGSRSAVEILVAAADREIGAAAIQVHRHGAGAVRQIPQHERAGRDAPRA